MSESGSQTRLHQRSGSESLSDGAGNVSKASAVNHPNFIPDGTLSSELGKHYASLGYDPHDVRSKPPSGYNGTHGNHGETNNSRTRVTRSLSYEHGKSDSNDAKNRGSVGSFGSCDSKTYDEEVVIAYNDEAVDIEEQGAGKRSSEGTSTGLRLVIVSSKVRNSSAIRGALKQTSVLVQYKHYTATLDSILELVSRSLGARRCESIAFLLSCSGLSIQLCGHEEKIQLLTRESIIENQSVRDFFTTLVSRHVNQSSESARLDFLACNLLLHTDGGSLDKELETCVGIPVRLYKDLGGSELLKSQSTDTPCSIGDQYFRLEKLRGWSGQQQQTLAGFEKIQTVGKGAYGAAVLYKKKDDDSLVILKEINMHDLKATERQMALNEVNILAMLEHPNIISYFDSFEEDGVIMIEMEYADGGTLAQYLSNLEKPLEEREVIVMFQQIVSAIRHIHEHNILHRDLKTANIFMTKEGQIKIGDFGISKMMSTANKGANTVLGTPYYISPEMCEGKPYNDRSDIWALGCILYEIACLQKTFEGTNLPALVNKIMKGQFAPVKGNYSQEFKDMIMLMLSQDPELRPSATQLYTDFIPKLLDQFEERTTTDNDDDTTARDKHDSAKKKTRSILYYFDSATAQLYPVELNPKVKIRAAAVGEDHVIVITTESQVFSWGEGGKGQLGHGDTLSLAKPKAVEALTGKSIVRACCGAGFSVFTSDRGIVLTCGDGAAGCLGHSDWSSVYRPRLIESLLSVDVIAVACGPSHVVVVGSDGEIFAWGHGTHGRLGLGNEDHYCQPMKVTVAESVLIRDVFCGMDGTMFLTDEGCVYACGNNEDNKLALNQRHGFIAAMRNIFTRCEVEGQKVPTLVRALRQRVIDISMGRYHTAVIVESGTVWSFGRNSEGQLGTEGTKQVNAPQEVKSITDKSIVRVQCGEHYTVASTNQNEILYWGLRFKDASNVNVASDNTGSRSSVAGNNEDDIRVESVTPRNFEPTPRKSDVFVGQEQTPRNDGQKSRNSQNLNPASRNSDFTPRSSEMTQRNLESMPQNSDAKKSDTLSGKSEGTSGKDRSSTNSSHSRQLSSTSGISIPSVDEPEVPDSTTDSGFIGEPRETTPAQTPRPGFRPLSSVPRRSTSANSRENSKDRDRDSEQGVRDNSEIIYPPEHLLRIMPTEELLTLISFFCHGENIFIQVETSAPPLRKKSRKKRGIRKRYSGSTLPVPASVNPGYSASSREGGDEYSSETSELDSQGTVPTWLKKELANTHVEMPPGTVPRPSDISNDDSDWNGADDTSDQSDEEDRKRATFESSMSSIQINRDLAPCKVPPDKNLTPRNSDLVSSSVKKSSPRELRPRSCSNSTESEMEVSNHSDSSSKDITLQGRSKTEFLGATSRTTRKPAGTSSTRVKSAASSAKWAQNRLRPGRNNRQDVGLKVQLAARGFVSDVTVRRREDALLGELQMTREEKQQAEQRLRDLERDQQARQEQYRQEAEQRSLEREKLLLQQIDLLKSELQSQNSQLQDNQKVVKSLQDQLNKLQNKKSKLGAGTFKGTSDSKVCSIQ